MKQTQNKGPACLSLLRSSWPSCLLKRFAMNFEGILQKCVNLLARVSSTSILKGIHDDVQRMDCGTRICIHLARVSEQGQVFKDVLSINWCCEHFPDQTFHVYKGVMLTKLTFVTKQSLTKLVSPSSFLQPAIHSVFRYRISHLCLHLTNVMKSSKNTLVD